MNNLHIEEVTAPQHTYSRGSSLLCDVASRFGLNIDESLEEQWRLTFQAMHKLDSILDSADSFENRSLKYDEMIEVITGNIAPEYHECSGCFACLLRDQASLTGITDVSIFASVAENVKIIGEKRRKTTTAKKLGNLSILEGKMSAKLFELNALDKSSEDFNIWLKNVGVAGMLIDTVIDLPIDYETGLTLVRPTFASRFSIASLSVPFIAKSTSKLKLSAIRSFVGACGAVADDRQKDLMLS